VTVTRISDVSPKYERESDGELTSGGRRHSYGSSNASTSARARRSDTLDDRSGGGCEGRLDAKRSVELVGETTVILALSD